VRVAVLADDLIWSTRLVEALRAAGAEPQAVRSLDAFAAALPGVDAVVVDLTARAYDGVSALGSARAAGRPALAIGQHDDRELRRRALSAGASRVFAYRKLFEDGPRTLAAWLGLPEPETAPR
jgi:DNA-binding response OmpR family regulator